MPKGKENGKMAEREDTVKFITIEQKDQLIDKLHEWLCELGYGDSPYEALYMAVCGANGFLAYCGIGVKDE